MATVGLIQCCSPVFVHYLQKSIHFLCEFIHLMLNFVGSLVIDCNWSKSAVRCTISPFHF